MSSIHSLRRAGLWLALAAVPVLATAAGKPAAPPGPADAAAPVPATRYEPALPYQPAQAGQPSPEHNWQRLNREAAASDPITLTMGEPPASRPPLDPAVAPKPPAPGRHDHHHHKMEGK